jgi:SecD/SecF fusion protein
MNIWLKSIGIGLAMAVIGFFLLRKMNDKNKTKKNDIEYTLRVNTSDNKEMNIKNVVEILEKRLNEAKYENQIKLTGNSEVTVTIQNIIDTNHVIKLLTSPGRIQFREMYQQADVAATIVKAEQILRQQNRPLEKEIESKPVREGMSKEVSQLLDSIEFKDKENTALTEASYPHFIFNYTAMNDIAAVRIHDTAAIRQVLESPEIKAISPVDIQYYYSYEKIQDHTSDNLFRLYAIRTAGQQERAVIENNDINEARQDFGYDGRTQITIKLKPVAAKNWATMTRKNINRPIAIIIDNLVLSAPIVQGEISGGEIALTGNFTVQETSAMALLLNSDHFETNNEILAAIKKEGQQQFPLKDLLKSALIFLVTAAITYYLFKTLKATEK